MKMKSFTLVVFCLSHFEILECRSTLAGNERGLALLGDLKNVRPELKLNL